MQRYEPMATRRAQTRRARPGVTLTEVVVSSALLVAALVPALRALTIAHMTGTQIEQKTQSLILAQSKLDEIRARSIHHYDTSFHERSSILAPSYLCDVADDEDASLRLVTVSVGHDDDANGRLAKGERDVTLASYVARRR